MMKKLKERKGFTMAELLIVVAIVAVLVAVSIPVFTGRLESAREATDAANIRAAYAEATVEAMESTDATVTREVTMKQLKAGWGTDIDEIGGVKKEKLPDVKKGDVVIITVTTDGSAATTIEKKS